MSPVSVQQGAALAALALALGAGFGPQQLQAAAALAAAGCAGLALLWPALQRGPKPPATPVPELSSQTAQAQRTLALIAQAALRAQSSQDLYQRLCHLCVETNYADAAWVGELVASELVPVAYSDAAAQRCATALREDVGPLSPRAIGPVGEACRTGELVVCNDIESDARTRPWRAKAAQFGIRATAVVPLRRGGAVVAALSLYANKTHAFDGGVQHVLNELREDGGYGLDKLSSLELRPPAAQEHMRVAGMWARSEARLARLIAATTDAICSVGADGKVSGVNRAGCVMFGVSEEAALGRPLAEFVFHHTADAPALADTPPGTAAAPRTRAMRGRRADGGEFAAELRVVAAESGSGALLTVQDLDAARALERAREAAAQTAAQASAKLTFFARMSHELRTTLTAVLGYSQLLAETAHERLLADEREQLQQVLDAGDELRELLDDALALARGEAERVKVHFEAVNVGDVLDAVRHVSEAPAAQRGVQLRFEAPRDPHLTLHTDAARLHQLLSSLVAHAIGQSRHGGWVRVQAQRVGSGLQLAVFDNGLSAAGAAHEREPEDAPPRRGHPGLGLVLARDLVDVLGGRVVVNSRQGVGTRVAVTLPWIEESDPAQVAAPPPDTALEPARVLYIEDSDINASLVARLLQRLPRTHLQRACTGQEGLRMARATPPHLILLDLHLPDMHGIELLRELRHDPRLGHLAIVALSASTLPEDIAAATAAGATDYWTKPLHFERFVGGVRRLLWPNEPEDEALAQRTPAPVAPPLNDPPGPTGLPH